MHANRLWRPLTAAAILASGVCAASTAKALVIGPVDLGLASLLETAVFGISRLDVSTDSEITSDLGLGNVGAGPQADPFKFSGSARVTGLVFHAPGNPPRITGSASVGGLNDSQDMAQAVADLQGAAAAAAALTPTQMPYEDVSELPSVGGVPTISGGEAVNVIDIDDIDLSSDGMLVLTAGVGEVMILNVGGLDLSSSSQIVLAGDLDTNEVLFNIADGFHTSSTASLSGGYLCVTCNAVHDGGVLNGFLYADEVSIGSRADVVYETPLPAVIIDPIPAPAVPALISLPAVFLGAGLIALGARRRIAA